MRPKRWPRAIPRGKSVPAPEDLVHQGIIDALRLLVGPGVLYWHPANEGERTPEYAAKLKKLGLLAGVPDLVFHLPGGQTGFLEIKRRDRWRLSPEQLVFKDAAMALGCRWAMVSSVDGALKILKEWGILKKGVRP